MDSSPSSTLATSETLSCLGSLQVLVTYTPAPRLGVVGRGRDKGRAGCVAHTRLTHQSWHVQLSQRVCQEGHPGSPSSAVHDGDWRCALVSPIMVSLHGFLQRQCVLPLRHSPGGTMSCSSSWMLCGWIGPW